MPSEIVPDTADGWSVSHQFFTVNWRALSKLSAPELAEVAAPLERFLTSRAQLQTVGDNIGQSAAFHILGEKASFLVLHFAKDFSQIAQAELDIARMPISDYLTPVYGYASVIELGMYHLTKKAHEQLTEKGLELHSKEWNEEYKKMIEPHRENLHERCFTAIPEGRYICFYPMNKRRGEQYNWYATPLDKRAEFMMEHGMTGRRYAGEVRQIITGSVGFDDWEWGVDLFADDAGAFKRLVYEMRFDEATSRYGEFGPFYLGLRVQSSQLESYLGGHIL